MASPAIIIVVIGVFLILLFLRMPIGFVFFAAGLLGVTLIRGFESAASTIGLAPYTESANYILVAIPLYIWMGQLVFSSGLSKELYSAINKWTGRSRGGLAHATIVACALFAACSGSSMAAVGSIGPVATKEMDRFNYRSFLSYGSMACGGTLGILIPPSLAFITYGYLCDVPIGPLFIAGIFPGILLTSMFMATTYFICVIDPSAGPAGPATTWSEKFSSLGGVWWSILIFLIIFVGIYAGVFTPTEAGGVSAAAVFFLLSFYRKMTWEIFLNSVITTARTTCMIFTIFIGAKVFNTFIGLSGIPQMAVELVSDLPLHPAAILALVVLAFVPVGCFIDAVPLAFLTLPTAYPIVQELGCDPLWFGVMFVLVSEISLVTPPVGMNVYVLSGVTGRPIERVFRDVAPFYVPMFITLTLVFVFPWISVFLPSTMK